MAHRKLWWYLDGGKRSYTTNKFLLQPITVGVLEKLAIKVASALLQISQRCVAKRGSGSTEPKEGWAVHYPRGVYQTG